MNNNSAIFDLSKKHQDISEKFNYFFLAATGACVGYALNKSAGVPLGWSLILLGAGILFWCVSFICGCLLVKKIQYLVFLNVRMLEAAQYKAVEFGGQIKEKIDSVMKLTRKLETLQWNSFLIGGAFFISWSITEIFRLAPK